MKVKGSNKKGWGILFSLLVCLFVAVPFLTETATLANAGESSYPEISPESTNCYYGYDYLGTLENGKILQKFYQFIDDLAWEFYCSDAEVEKLDNEYGYPVAISADITQTFTEEEINIIRANWAAIEKCFKIDTPLYYYMRFAYGVSFGFSLENQDIFQIYATHYADGDTGEWLEEFVSVENRMMYRNLIEDKLQEYYDLTKNLETDYEKELAIHRKMLSEVDYDDGISMSLYNHSIIGAFTGSETVCDGYAQAFQLICNYCGIDCLWVDGMTALGAHAWNAVKLGEEWYCVDATWNDGDATQYWDTSTYGMADDPSEMYLNTPNAIFSMSHFPYSKEKGETEIEWPEFSEDDTYWSVYIMNEQADTYFGGIITEEQAEKTCAYVREQLETGNLRFELGAWDNFIPDLGTEGGSIYNLISQTVNEFVSSTGETYELAVGFSYSSQGNVFENRMFDCASVVLTQKVEYSDNIVYYKYNIDGSGSGILLENYPVDGERFAIPGVINGEEVRAIRKLWFWDIPSRQLVLPEGVKILSLSGDNLEQIVVPESVTDIYGLGGKYVDDIYIPKDIRHIMSLSYWDLNLQQEVYVDTIYGYAGSLAEEYANENNLIFYDVTGKDLIETIDLEGFVLPSGDQNIQETLAGNCAEFDGFSITSVVCDTEDETVASEKEYSVSIYVSAKDGKAITPNTLATVNGSVTSIDNIDTTSAVITYLFKSELEEDETDTPEDTVLNGVTLGADGIWAYYADGVIDTAFTGLATNESGTWYIEDGYLNWDYTELFSWTDGWYYVMNGRVPTEYTGLVRNSAGLWYVEGGKINQEYTNLVSSAEGWYYVMDGRVTEEYTGLVRNSEGLWYVAGGKLDESHTDLVSSVEGWYYVMNGRVTEEYTGLVRNSEGLWYVAAGKLDDEYTNLVSSVEGWFYAMNGRVTEEYTGLVENENGNWYVEKGVVSLTHEGLVCDATGWWYVIESHVAPEFTGLATNDAGTWYVQNGYLDFDFSGTVTIDEVVYTVVGGLVQE